MRRAAPADAKGIAGGTATHIAMVSSARAAISKGRLSRISLALGSRAGAPVRRLGRDPAGMAPSSRGPRPTTLDGLDLHANVWVPRRDRGRLERLCRDVLQPPAAQERLQCRPDGRVLVASGWATGSWALMLSSTEAVVKALLGCVVGFRLRASAAARGCGVLLGDPCARGVSAARL